MNMEAVYMLKQEIFDSVFTAKYQIISEFKTAITA